MECVTSGENGGLFREALIPLGDLRVDGEELEGGHRVSLLVEGDYGVLQHEHVEEIVFLRVDIHVDIHTERVGETGEEGEEEE